MDIKSTLYEYKSLGDYFAPEYERENAVLNNFKKNNPTLSTAQTNQLIDILKNSSDYSDKYFVADLLYLYRNFDKELLDQLLVTAIYCPDPSFNRIFLNPSLNLVGTRSVADILTDKFNTGNIVERIGIASLAYWLRPKKQGEVENLRQAILTRANSTENLVELYFYKLLYPDKIRPGEKIPGHAVELIEAIKGNQEYENLLFNDLNWRKD